MRNLRLGAWLGLVLLVLAGCNSPRPAASRAHAETKTASPAHPARRYAVLLNSDSAADHQRNIARAYSTLRSLGFPAADIYVLSTRDRRNPLPKDTPFDRPSHAQFARVMDHLAAAVAPGDQVVLYGTGHGDTEDGESLLELRRSELFAGELRAQVERLRGTTVVVMDQCFSGGFLDAFEGTPARVLVVTTVDRNHMTYCGAFARAFWDAFLHPETADRNHDGKTSIREAFNVAFQAHQKELKGDPELRATAACRSFNGLEDALLN